MNLFDDPNILAPPSLKPQFLHKSSQLVFQLPLLNQHPHPIHFYVSAIAPRSPRPLGVASRKHQISAASSQTVQ
jgi:hypothetical protein